MKNLHVYFCFITSLIIINSFNAFSQTPDPGLMGTHTVIKAEYNLGDLAFTPPSAASFPSNMEVRGSVHYPSDLSTGPFPVIFYMHGRHETCYDSVSLSTSSAWPCTGTNKPIVSYEGYDYSATTLASHGYIVISVSANAINAIDGGLSDYGMNARGVLMQHHLDLWNTWNTAATGPFGTLFNGKLNMQNIGTMGHSRGGEGVVFNALYNRSLGSPYGIKAVLTLAPVDFLRHILNGIPLLDIAPYCDGDVSDLQGVHFYDDSRYADTTDESPKHTILFLGANHNYFNTVWTPGSYVAGGIDDWYYTGSATDPQCGTAGHRFDTTKQKAAYNAYSAAFFRLYLGHETNLAPILEVNDIVPPASSLLDSSNVFVSYHPGHSDRLDVNRTDSLARDTINTLHALVNDSDIIAPHICNGGYTMPACGVSGSGAQEPHHGSSSTKGLGEMSLYWSDTSSWYQNTLPPAYKNLSGYQNLLFRASENFSQTSYGTNLNFTVELIDSLGATSNQIVTNHSHALFYQPGTQTGDLPKVVFNTINIPLSSFTGINLTKVSKIKFKFNKSTAGSILISDLAFTNPICGNLTTSFTDSIGGKYKVFFTNKSTNSSNDSVTYLWNFGDVLSGVNDTSTQLNPYHKFTTHNTYTVCLHITSYRKNSFVCTDSFCKTIVLLNDEVPVVLENDIKIIPNPAKDYLQVIGAENSDIIKLINMYGQVILTENITQSIIRLPNNLVAGIYVAEIITKNGTIYKKIMINK